MYSVCIVHLQDGGQCHALAHAQVGELQIESNHIVRRPTQRKRVDVIVENQLDGHRRQLAELGGADLQIEIER